MGAEKVEGQRRNKKLKEEECEKEGELSRKRTDRT